MLQLCQYPTFRDMVFSSLQNDFLSTMAAKLKMPTSVHTSFSGGAIAFPQGVLAKQLCPPSHSAFVPLGQGLALSQSSTSSPHDAPQKNLEVTSSNAVSDASSLLSLPPMRGVQIVGEGEASPGLPPVGLLPAEDCSCPVGSLGLQGVPLKHCCLFGQSDGGKVS